MDEDIRLEYISEFRTGYPEIPIPEDIDITELGESPHYITLPIAKVDARSRSGRIYTQEAVASIVRQVNEKRPEGRWGHLKPEERSTRYEMPAVRWLASILDADGMAWAKGIALTEQADKHFRVAKATNARVGTSVYGKPLKLRGSSVLDMSLESIDIADPERVGVPETAAFVQITSEMEDNPMSEQLIQELTTDRNKYRDQFTDAEKAISEMENELKAVTSQRDNLNTILAEMNLGEDPVKAFRVIQEQAAKFEGVVKVINEKVGEGKDPVTVIAEFASALEKANGAVLESRIKDMIAEMVTAEPLRPHAQKHLDLLRKYGEVHDEDSAKHAIQEFVEDEDNKKLAQTLVSEMSGGRVIVGSKPDSDAYSKAGFVSFDDSLQAIGG